MNRFDGHPIPRRGAHQERFADINRQQDPRQYKENLRQLAEVTDINADGKGEPTDPTVQAWLDEFAESIRSGKRHSTDRNHRLNECADGVVIPRNVSLDIRRTLGGERDRFQDKGYHYRDPKPFTVKTLTDELDCNRKEATVLLTFIILLHSKYDIEQSLKYPEVYSKAGSPVDTDKIQSVFHGPEFINQVTNSALEASLPLLARQATVGGVHHIVKRLRVFGFKPNETKLHAAFATDARRVEFRRVMTANQNDGLHNALETYEYLFGELSSAEFVEIFPDWHSVVTPRYARILSRKYNVELPKSAQPEEVITPATLAVSSEPIQPAEMISTIVTDRVLEPAILISEPDALPPALLNTIESRQPEAMSNLPSLRTAVKWGAMALTLCAGLGSAAFEAGKAAFKFAHGEAADQAEPSLDKIEAKVLRQKEGAYTNVPSLKQFNRIESNNHGGPEIITIETGDFVAEPPLYGMRATGVFTTIGENGAITYEPVHAFMPDPVEFKDLAMTDHIVAERVFAQGKVLYPPELGMIDPNSIHLDGYTAADYTVTAGEQGRLLVTLNKPPVEPFKILYIARELDGYTVPFMDAQPAIPGIGNPELVEHIRSHDLKPYPTEDEYTFALRARSTIQREYHYPRGHAEESLSFNQAVAQHIGDCDVSNQELLAILQSNHVEAELVADFAPVPGREKHGQVRAIVYSQELDQTVIVSLDATPGTYTEASRSAQSAQAKKTEVRPVKPVLSVNEDAIEIESSQVETDQAELAALIDRYQAEHIGVSQLEDTAIDTGQTMLDEQQSAEERDTGTSENTGESAVVSTVTTQPETLNSLQEKTPATANPDVTSALEPVSEKEQKALAGGLYGYSHYLLRHSLSLPENKAAQVRLTTEFMLDVMQELKYKGVIPADQDPYEWSKHITPTRARQVVDALNHSDYIRFRLSLLSGMEYDRKAR